MGEGMKRAKKAARSTRAHAPMRVVYGVPWIEVEFGQRDEGWALYTDKATCFADTKRASEAGPMTGGYLGPARPLTAYEIPFDSLDEKLKKDLAKSGKTHTDDHWSPQFRGTPHAVT